jgi:hypothetical protein
LNRVPPLLMMSSNLHLSHLMISIYPVELLLSHSTLTLQLSDQISIFKNGSLLNSCRLQTLKCSDEYPFSRPFWLSNFWLSQGNHGDVIYVFDETSITWSCHLDMCLMAVVHLM